MSLQTHWKRGQATEKLVQHQWDYVVLQDQSTMPLKNPKRLTEFAVKFAEQCRKHSTKAALYCTWARQDAPERQADITAAYTQAASAADAILVPVGKAWERSLLHHPDLILHESDKSHPNVRGTYLAGCVFYATLLEQTPVGLPAHVLPELEAAKLQQIAARVSGITADSAACSPR